MTDPNARQRQGSKSWPLDSACFGLRRRLCFCGSPFGSRADRARGRAASVPNDDVGHFLPVAPIWVAAIAARSSRVMREESHRLRGRRHAPARTGRAGQGPLARGPARQAGADRRPAAAKTLAGLYARARMSVGLQPHRRSSTPPPTVSSATRSPTSMTAPTASG